MSFNDFKNRVIIEDNFLEDNSFQKYKRHITSGNYSWYYNSNSTYKKGMEGATNRDLTELNGFGFSSMMYTNDEHHPSPFGKAVHDEVLNKIKDYWGLNNIIRARFDMLTRVEKPYIHMPHVDYYFPHISAILYINNSDGDTVIYNEQSSTDKISDDVLNNLTIKKRITPKENRLIIFDGSFLHTGYSPTNNKRRILLNCNFT